jgi:hypothetical protein
MSVFSYTAPIITKEEEELERLALSAEEKEELQKHLYGPSLTTGANGTADNTDSNNNSNNHDNHQNAACDCFTDNSISSGMSAANSNDLDGYDVDSKNRAVQLLLDNMVALPNEDTVEYYEARERVPDLVRSESDPQWFLEREKYDIWAASKRLALYWKVRKDVFGTDRAFLPMTICSGGAMVDDLSKLQLGCLQLLPNDIHGRLVIFVDRIRAVKPIVTREEFARIAFYWLHVAVSRAAAQREPCGPVCIVNLKGYDMYRHFDRILSRKYAKVRDGMPLQLMAYHGIIGGFGKSVFELVSPVLKHVQGKDFRLHLVMHTGKDQEIVDRLALYGLTGDHNLSFVNSTYVFNNDMLVECLVQQRNLEQTRKVEEIEVSS